jgi:hypothetical protein
MEVPAYPMDHERALTGIASVLLFFNAAIVLIFALVYIFGRSQSWEEVWVGDDWVERRVTQWEWVIAGVFMMAASGTGVAGGIAAAKSTRYTVAMLAAVLLLGAAMILQLDWYRFEDERYGQLLFVLVLALLPLILLLMSKPSFRDPVPVPGTAPRQYETDNYGWSTMPGGVRDRTGGRRGGGP